MNNIQTNKLRYARFIIFLRETSIYIALIMLHTPPLLIFIILLLSSLIMIMPSLVAQFIIQHVYNFVRPILYVWALIITIGGKQDVFAILFYILSGVQAISIIKNLFYSILVIVNSFSKE